MILSTLKTTVIWCGESHTYWNKDNQGSLIETQSSPPASLSCKRRFSYGNKVRQRRSVTKRSKLTKVWKPSSIRLILHNRISAHHHEFGNDYLFWGALQYDCCVRKQSMQTGTWNDQLEGGEPSKIESNSIIRGQSKATRMHHLFRSVAEGEMSAPANSERGEQGVSTSQWNQRFYDSWLRPRTPHRLEELLHY